MTSIFGCYWRHYDEHVNGPGDEVVCLLSGALYCFFPDGISSNSELCASLAPAKIEEEQIFKKYSKNFENLKTKKINQKISCVKNLNLTTMV